MRCDDNTDRQVNMRENLNQIEIDDCLLELHRLQLEEEAADMEEELARREEQRSRERDERTRIREHNRRERELIRYNLELKLKRYDVLGDVNLMRIKSHSNASSEASHADESETTNDFQDTRTHAGLDKALNTVSQPKIIDDDVTSQDDKPISMPIQLDQLERSIVVTPSNNLILKPKEWQPITLNYMGDRIARATEAIEKTMKLQQEHNKRVMLPTIALQVFNGKITEFSTFRESFMHNIDYNSDDSRLKLMTLMELDLEPFQVRRFQQTKCQMKEKFDHS